MSLQIDFKTSFNASNSFQNRFGASKPLSKPEITFKARFNAPKSVSSTQFTKSHIADSVNHTSKYTHDFWGYRKNRITARHKIPYTGFCKMHRKTALKTRFRASKPLSTLQTRFKPVFELQNRFQAPKSTFKPVSKRFSRKFSSRG